MKFSKKTIKHSIYRELDNVKINIVKKAQQLDVSMPELAVLADISYKSLWRFMNDTNVPNYEILDKIAKFLNITVSELLSYPESKTFDIPIIELTNIQDFINCNALIDNEYIVVNEFIDKNSFAIRLNKTNQQNIYIFKPYDKIIKGIVIFQNNSDFVLAKIFEINNDCIRFFNLSKQKQYSYQLSIDDIKIIALAVKQIVNSDLL
jgi:transcriptional regulator with XRE-family HTH domain